MAIALTKALRLGLLASLLLISPVLAAGKNKKSEVTSGCDCIWENGDRPEDKVKSLDDDTTKACHELYGPNAAVGIHIGAKSGNKTLMCSGRTTLDIVYFGTECRNSGHSKGALCCNGFNPKTDDCEFDFGLADFYCMQYDQEQGLWAVYNEATDVACNILHGTLNEANAHVGPGVHTCLPKNSGNYEPDKQARLWGPACAQAKATGIQILPRGSIYGRRFVLPINETLVTNSDKCWEDQKKCMKANKSFEECAAKFLDKCNWQ